MAAPKSGRKVRILAALAPISRADGTSFPAFRDDEVTVPPAVAKKLIDAGHAEPISARKSSKASTAEKGSAESDEADDADPATSLDDDAGDVAENEGDDTDGDIQDSDGDVQDSEDTDGQAQDDNAPSVDKPAKTAPVAAWRDYAVAQGMDADEAGDAARADLIALYG